MRILLTGATGFIGRHLATAILARGHELVCTSRSPRPQSEAEARAHYVQADFTRDVTPDVWLSRVAGMDVVINAVGILQERGAQTFATIHTRAPQALFAASEQAGVRRVIQISALGADDDARSRYHLSKREADLSLERCSCRWVIVQPSLVFGESGTSARMFTTLATLPVLPLPGRGGQAVQPVHIDDVVATIIALLEPDSVAGVRVTVAGPQAMSFRQFLVQLRTSMGLSSLHTINVPMPLVKLGAALGSRVPGVMLDSETLAMLNRGNSGEISLMQGLLGRLPREVSGFIPPERAIVWRTQAQLNWILPMVRLSLALVWIVTGVLSLGVYPTGESYALLNRVGITGSLASVVLYGAAVLDLVIGCCILLLRQRQWLWLLQIALILGYTLIITFKLPEYWLHPYGPILKNLPILAAIWMIYELERKPTADGRSRKGNQ